MLTSGFVDRYTIKINSAGPGTSCKGGPRDPSLGLSGAPGRRRANPSTVLPP
jgi:hypothetical protein